MYNEHNLSNHDKIVTYVFGHKLLELPYELYGWLVSLS